MRTKITKIMNVTNVTNITNIMIYRKEKKIQDTYILFILLKGRIPDKF